MERFLLPSKRSRNCSLVPSENEDINVNLPDVENVSDVDSETEESADAFAADAETALVQLQVDISTVLWVHFHIALDWNSEMLFNECQYTKYSRIFDWMLNIVLV